VRVSKVIRVILGLLETSRVRVRVRVRVKVRESVRVRV
jgi:hypothetical protein